MSSELDRKFSSLRQVFEDLVIKKAALKSNTTVIKKIYHISEPFFRQLFYFDPC